jgi:hypothetical protein
MVARTSAQRGVDQRERQKCGLHVCWVDIDRSLVIAAKVMTAASPVDHILVRIESKLHHLEGHFRYQSQPSAFALA